MREIPYDRNAAVSYARIWAHKRNPTYYDFEKIGGDCTNFASQSIYAGAGIMNYTPVITAVTPTILVAAHTFDALDRPLDSYIYDVARFLHIDGVRVW